MPREPLPQILLVRHGETTWSASGRHTSSTDVPLTERGEDAARFLGVQLVRWDYDLVLSSPLLRARRTCDLAGFGELAEDDPDLVEFQYGDYEGLTTAEIRRGRPDWEIFRDGCPGGESVDEVSARADRLIGRLRAVAGDVLVFSHAHFLRCLAVRWVGLDGSAARLLTLETASVGILGYNHGLDEPVLRLWNDADFRVAPQPDVCAP